MSQSNTQSVSLQGKSPVAMASSAIVSCGPCGRARPTSNASTRTQQPTMFDQSDISRKLYTSRRLCRICRKGTELGPFITPCLCMGPFASVHKACIESWVLATRQENCDICRYKLHLTYHHVSFWAWFFSQASNYKWELLELIYRFFAIVFYSILGFAVVYCIEREVGGGGGGGSVVFGLVLSFLYPLLRLYLYTLVVKHRFERVKRHYEQAIKTPQRVEVHDNCELRRQFNMPDNSALRVSGMRNIRKYVN